MMVPLRAASLALAFIFIAACQYDPHAHLYTTVKPAPRDVAGVYRLTSETLMHSDLSQFGGRSCIVHLNVDGTFAAENVPPPGIENPGRDLVERLRSASGTWSIIGVGGVDNGWSTREVWGVSLQSPGVALASANLTGEKAPYGLIFSFGDPDAGEVLILTRDR